MQRHNDCGFGSRGEGSRYLNPSDSATDILDKRFALGKIAVEEYAEQKRVLTQPK